MEHSPDPARMLDPLFRDYERWFADFMDGQLATHADIEWVLSVKESPIYQRLNGRNQPVGDEHLVRLLHRADNTPQASLGRLTLSHITPSHITPSPVQYKKSDGDYLYVPHTQLETVWTNLTDIIKLNERDGTQLSITHMDYFLRFFIERECHASSTRVITHPLKTYHTDSAETGGVSKRVHQPLLQHR